MGSKSGGKLAEVIKKGEVVSRAISSEKIGALCRRWRGVWTEMERNGGQR